jgi:hydroxylamine reductase
MFCFQCEQTAKGEGCTKIGVCGKQPDVAALQDLLVYTVKGIAQVAVEGAKVNVSDPAVNQFTCEAIFSTLTNVDFDPARFVTLVNDAVKHRDALKAKVQAAGGNVAFADGPATYSFPRPTRPAWWPRAKRWASNPTTVNPDIRSLRELIVYGIKGLAAYADHARILGQEDDVISMHLFTKAMAATLDNSLGADDYVGLALKCGEVNLRAMELLDAGNTGTYGHPVPTAVPLGAKKGKAILVSGHDLKDLEIILKQTEGKGINVYTHGEMLPCHGYPELKKYSHFYGHYGTAWQNQAKEFAAFPGAIVMTTNCIQKPRESYQDNIFTTGLVGWPGVSTSSTRTSPRPSTRPWQCPALKPTSPARGHGRFCPKCGHGRGAHGHRSGQEQSHPPLSSWWAAATAPNRAATTTPNWLKRSPSDCVVLTLACGKFRFFDKDLGDIGGIPRLLDVGQCNDAYSAIQIAVALAGAFECGVNDLPLSMILSWYEQKACVILLSLLHLGIKDIRLGPSLPAFITPNVLDVLVKNFNIMPIGTPDEDLKAILG